MMTFDCFVQVFGRRGKDIKWRPPTAPKEHFFPLKFSTFKDMMNVREHDKNVTKFYSLAEISVSKVKFYIKSF